MYIYTCDAGAGSGVAFDSSGGAVSRGGGARENRNGGTDVPAALPLTMYLELERQAKNAARDAMSKASALK